MRRREFITVLGGAVVAWPLAGRAQQTGKVYRVGLIITTSPVSEMVGSDPIHPLVRTFVRTWRALGYVEGQNLILERRSAEGKFERFGEIATDLIRHGIDVIVVSSILVAKETIRVTNTVPIVMASNLDPVGAGVVTNLARPGGNITGFTTNAGPEIEAKRLELLKEVLPQASRVAFLGLKSDWESPEAEGIRVAARMMGVTLVHAEHTRTNYADAFALITRDRAEALFVASQAASYANRQVIRPVAGRRQRSWFRSSWSPSFRDLPACASDRANHAESVC